jgi:hypothetical protein
MWCKVNLKVWDGTAGHHYSWGRPLGKLEGLDLHDQKVIKGVQGNLARVQENDAEVSHRCLTGVSFDTLLVKN